jgi:hypothetical protein
MLEEVEREKEEQRRQLQSNKIMSHHGEREKEKQARQLKSIQSARKKNARRGMKFNMVGLGHVSGRARQHHSRMPMKYAPEWMSWLYSHLYWTTAWRCVIVQSYVYGASG